MELFTAQQIQSLNELQNFLWRVGTPEYDAALDEAAGLIARAERVFLVGIGNSGSMAEYGARYLSNLGKFALSVTDPFYPVTVTPNVTMTAVLLSVSGETVQILHLAQQFKARGCSLIAITSSPQNTLAKMADMTLPYYTTARPADHRQCHERRKPVLLHRHDDRCGRHHHRHHHSGADRGLRRKGTQK